MFKEEKEVSTSVKLKRLHKSHCADLLSHNKKAKLPGLKEFARQAITSEMGGEELATTWLKNKAGACDKPRTRLTPPPGGGFCGKPKKKGCAKPKPKRFAPRRTRKQSNWYSR